MPYLFLLDFAYAQAAKIVARIFTPYLRKCWRRAVREGRDRQGAGGLGKGSPGLHTRALRRARLWVWQVWALVKPDRNAAARRGAACGRYRRNPVRNAGWFDARFFAGSEPRVFSEPGFWPRRDGLRRPDRGAGLAVRACSAGLAGLAGSAVRVILQDWQDRWNVAQIGAIPETGDPRCRSHMPAPHAPSVPDTCR